MAIQYAPKTDAPPNKAPTTLPPTDHKSPTKLTPLTAAIEAIEYNGPKKAISIRLDEDVLEKLKATGPKWQSRTNYLLRRAMNL